MSETPKPGTPKPETSKPETPKPKDFDKFIFLSMRIMGRCCWIVIIGAILLSMIILGAINYSNCQHSSAALYLILTGVVGIFWTLLSQCLDTKIAILFKIWYFINLIWGSVTVFGKIRKFRFILQTLIWYDFTTGAYGDIKTNIEDEGEEVDCQHDTYYFAFVWLILSWIYAPFYIIHLVIRCWLKPGTTKSQNEENVEWFYLF